ncbi:mutator type transposase [Tanacetum coccineum]
MDGTEWKIKQDNGNYKMPIEYDKFSVHELNGVMEKLGYVNDDPIYYHYMIPGTDLQMGLRALGNDLDVLGLGSTVVIEELPSVTPHVTPPPTKRLLLEYHKRSSTPHVTPPPTTTVTQNATPSLSKRKFTKNSANRLKSAVNDIEPMPLHTNVDTNETVDCIMQELMSMNYEFDPFVDNMTASLNAQPSVNEQERTRVVNNEPEETLVGGETIFEDEEESGTEEDDSDSEDDEDYFFDEETYLEEVNVDMADYHFNIDVDVEWVRHSEIEQEQMEKGLSNIDVRALKKKTRKDKELNKMLGLVIQLGLIEERGQIVGRAESDILLNNLCECFNGKILDARDAPIITALEYTREYLMRRMENVIAMIKKTDGPLTPSATKLLKIAMERANNYTVRWNGGEEYEVKGQHGNQCVVNVVNKVCSCRKWELTGIPCAHVIAANYNMALNGIQVGILKEWVHKCYWLATWKHTYSYTLGCLNGRVMWKKSQIPTTLTLPKHNTPVGRPRKNRRKTKEERAQMRCTCKAKGSRHSNLKDTNVAAGTRKRPSDASTTPSTAPATRSAKKKQATSVGSANACKPPSTASAKKKQATSVGPASGKKQKKK